MYTFEIDIGSWASPVVGGGYISCTPQFEECTLGRVKEKGIFREKLNGNLIFTRDEYDALKLLSATEIQVHLKIYYKASLRIVAYLQLQGSYDVRMKQASLQVETDDQYVKLLDSMDTEFNIKTLDRSTIVVNAQSYLDTFYEGRILGGTTLGRDNYLQCSTTLPPAWNAGTSYAFADFLGSYYYQGVIGCFCLSGGIVYACKLDNVNKPPAINPAYWQPLLGNLRVFKQERSLQMFTNSVYDTEIGMWVYASCTANVYTYNLTHNILLYDVLKAMLEVIDPTILITDTGVNIYSAYLDADPELRGIFIADKSDIKYYDASNEAGYEYIKFQQLLNIYKFMFNLDWHINSNGYFVFQHPTEIAAALPLETVLPLHFLTTVRSRNWTKDRTGYKISEDQKIHKETWLFEKSNSWDFDGVPIVYDNNFTTNQQYELAMVNCNVSELMSGTYSQADNGGVCVIAAQWVTDHWETVDKTSSLGFQLVNGKMATTFLLTDHHITGGRPYVKGTVNDVPDVVLVTGNNKEVADLIVPSQDIDALDFDYLIETDLGNLEPVNFEVPLNGSISKLKCSFK